MITMIVNSDAKIKTFWAVAKKTTTATLKINWLA